MKKTSKKQSYHLLRACFAACLLLTITVVQMDAHGTFSAFRGSPSGSVLAYAAEMSRDALYSATNAARAANGLGPLRFNSQLNSSAQMKAQHLMDNDYWAHVAPDGTQPWYFFQAAGYAYSRAGENLAYGFASSQSTVDGWMNSPSHRANILGEFVDVGFGIVNAPNYQASGNQTIVVAHYGTPLNYTPPAPVASSAPPPPATSAPAPPPSSKPSSSPTTSPTPAQTPTTAPAQPTEQPVQRSDETREEEKIQQPTAPLKEQNKTANFSTGSNEQLSLIGLLAQKRAPIVALSALAFVGMITSAYALTHRKAFAHAVRAGEVFALRHPSIDAAIVLGAIAVILLTSYGHIG